MLRTRKTRQIQSTQRARLWVLPLLMMTCLTIVVPQGPIGPQPSKAQEAPQRSVAPEELDFTGVPNDAVLVAAVKPNVLASSPELAEALKSVDLGALVGGEGIAAAEIAQLTFVGFGPDSRYGGGNSPLPFQLVLLRTVSENALAMLPKILGPEYKELKDGNATYYQSTAFGSFAALLNERTLALTESEPLARALTQDSGARLGFLPWYRAAGELGDRDVMIALNTASLIQSINLEMASPIVASLEPMFTKSYGYAAGLDLSAQTSLKLVAYCGTEEGALQVAETTSALKVLGMNALRTLPSRLAQGRADFNLSVQMIVDQVEGALRKSEVATEGTIVRLDTEFGIEGLNLVQIMLGPLTTARARAREAQRTNNLKLIGIALHNYSSVYDKFPPPVLYSENGTPYSWRVEILPYMEQAPLYDKYRFDEPWNSPANLELLKEMPSTYDAPGSNNDPTEADYFTFVGPRTILGAPGEGTTFGSVRDGFSNTLMAVETRRPIPWTKPEDIPFDVEGMLPKLGGFREGHFLALFGDGSVLNIKLDLDESILRALITRDGGEVISYDSFQP